MHHAPTCFFFCSRICQSRPTWLHTCIRGCCTHNFPYQLSALRVSVGIFQKKKQRCKRLATPHANWSTCNFPKIKFEQHKNCNCNCNLINIPVRKPKKMHVNISVQIVELLSSLVALTLGPYTIKYGEQ